MKCMDPILCYTSGKKRLFRHYSQANPSLRLISQQVFNCGTCIFCRKKRAHELAVRCVLHSSLYKQNCFLTLTYDEKKTDYHNNFQYKDIQEFKKRLRRHCEYHYDKKIQIFNVHEYGKNGKKHWHLVLFNHDFEDKTLYTVKNNNKLYTSKKLEKLWPFGFNTIGDITEASAMYTAQYTQKDFKNGNENNKKKSHSKHSGIGRDYFLSHYRQILSLGYIPFNGKKIAIPRYFQKIAHKHYSHYYAPENFFDFPDRKKLYSPFDFRRDWPTKEIADLYIQFTKQKQIKIDELSQEWENEVKTLLHSGATPDFEQSAKNYLHDLKNKTNNNTF